MWVVVLIFFNDFSGPTSIPEQGRLFYVFKKSMESLKASGGGEATGQGGRANGTG
jgi:hypothetical protein